MLEMMDFPLKSPLCVWTFSYVFEGLRRRSLLCAILLLVISIDRHRHQLASILFAASASVKGASALLNNSSHYDSLEISRDASQSDIKKSYRRLSLLWHPDKVNKAEKEEATLKFQQITNAYEVLSDSKRRKYYDFYGDQHESMQEYFDDIIYRYNIPELYAFAPNINILFEKNLNDLLTKSDASWVVTFYHPNCGSCRRAVSTMSKLAEMSRDRFPPVRVGTMNCAIDMNLCHRFDIDHLGETFIFPPQQEEGGFWEQHRYNGPLNAKSILDAVTSIPRSYLIKLDSMDDLRNQMMSQPAIQGKSNAEAIWIVDYYKPTCPPCRQLKMELKKLSSSIPHIKIATLDCSQTRCEVPYFPFIRLFIRRNGKLDVVDMDYDKGGLHPAAFAIKVLGMVSVALLDLQHPHRRGENFREEL